MSALCKLLRYVILTFPMYSSMQTGITTVSPPKKPLLRQLDGFHHQVDCSEYFIVGKYGMAATDRFLDYLIDLRKVLLNLFIYLSLTG